jgi:hypothetical protein
MNFIGISNSPAHVAGPPNNYPVVSPAVAEDYQDDDSFMPDGSVVGTFNSVITEHPVEVDEYIGELHDEAHDFIVDIRDESGASKARKAKSALGHLDDFLKNVFQSQNQSEFKRDYVKAEDLTFDPNRWKEADWWDTMIGKFFTYLADTAVKRTVYKVGNMNVPDHIAYETATGYASSIKDYYCNKFRKSLVSIPVFHPESWRKLRGLLHAKFQRRAVANGTSITNPHLASESEDREALSIGCVWWNTAVGAEFWHLNNSMTHCVGRGSNRKKISVDFWQLTSHFGSVQN